MKRLILSIAMFFTVAAAQTAPPISAEVRQPKLTNAKLHVIPAGVGLEKTVTELIKSQTAPMWIGYSIPVEAKERTMCCFDDWRQQSNNNCCFGCRLEKEAGNFFNGHVDNGTSTCDNLEPADFAFIMLRSEAGALTKVRAFSRDCGLDAAGLNVYWIENVNPVDSIKYLAKLAESDRDSEHKKSIGDQAVYAVAIHNNPAADAALESLLTTSHPRRIRQHVAIMLGSERGKNGLAILRNIMKNDSDDKFREEALVGFAQSGSDDGLRELVDIAKNDSSSRVRGQAIFWLGQAGGRKEASEISDAIDSDPDTDVKRKAVFALAQMPANEGVPMLIHVAKTNKNPAVRREAVRWLGHTNDPRSLAFLEEILLGGKQN
ncbi:MAG: lyase domain protein repeat-containing protein [Acidobacteriaceae bacterium]|nr:lyase domain protein repeat-containing protein [Acidobacteriaceae bacterium]